MRGLSHLSKSRWFRLETDCKFERFANCFTDQLPNERNEARVRLLFVRKRARRYHLLQQYPHDRVAYNDPREPLNGRTIRGQFRCTVTRYLYRCSPIACLFTVVKCKFIKISINMESKGEQTHASACRGIWLDQPVFARCAPFLL